MYFLKNKYLLFVYFLLLLYTFQDITNSAQAGFKEGADRSIVYVILISIILLFSSYIVYYRLNNNIRWFGVSFVLFLILLWEISVDLLLSADIRNMFIRAFMSLWWMLSLYFSYLYVKANPKSVDSVLIINIVMFFVYVYANVFLRMNIVSRFGKDYATSGYVYFILVFIPYIMLITRKWVRMFLLLIAIVFVITGYKRGAIIILPAMILIYYYTELKVNVFYLNKIVYILKAILVFVVFSFVMFIIDCNYGGVLSARFGDEDMSSGSGRDVIYSSAIKLIENRPFEDLFFGTGGDSTLKLLGINAHNEWLEFMFCYGIVGVILYLSFILSLIFRYYKLLKEGSQYAPHWGMLTVYVVLVGMFGMFYFTHSSFYVFFLIGLLESKIEQNFKFAHNECIESKY